MAVRSAELRSNPRLIGPCRGQRSRRWPADESSVPIQSSTVKENDQLLQENTQVGRQCLSGTMDQTLSSEVQHNMGQFMWLFIIINRKLVIHVFSISSHNEQYRCFYSVSTSFYFLIGGFFIWEGLFEGFFQEGILLRGFFSVGFFPYPYSTR